MMGSVGSIDAYAVVITHYVSFGGQRRVTIKSNVIGHCEGLSTAAMQQL